MMTNTEFASRLIDVATKHKTLYVLGCIGAPLNSSNKERYTNNYPYNTGRAKMIQAASADTFGFDCVCLIKSMLWGWEGDIRKVYGGAKYVANGVPDIGADSIINVCKNISTNFSNITVGELVWMPGHVGVYIGNGLAVECTPAWKNGVQITACNCTKKGYNRRNWKKHGKLPYVKYVLESGEDIVAELISGKGVQIHDVAKAVRAVNMAKNHPDFLSLYWILHKLVNGNG